MKIKLPFFTLILFVSFSCSQIIPLLEEESVDTRNLEKNKSSKLNPNILPYCPNEKSNLQIVGSRQEYLQAATTLFKKNPKLELVDKFVLLSLLHMQLRPDIATPDAPLQVIHIKKNKVDSYYFTGPSNPTTELKATSYIGLEHLLKRFGKASSQNKLMQLSRILDNFHLPPFKVSQSFNRSIKPFSELILNSPAIRSHYSKGESIVLPGESLPTIRYEKLLAQFQKSLEFEKKKNLNIQSYQTHLFNRFFSQQEYQCNVDIDLYKKSMFLISPESWRSVLYGIQEGEELFIGIQTANHNNLELIPNSHLIRHKSHSMPAPFCFAQNSDKFFLAVSTKGRDPGQYLYNYLALKPPEASNLEEIAQLISMQRSLLLFGPLRIVTEADNNGKDLLRELQSLGPPIYHGQNLGLISSFFSNETNKVSGFVGDPREGGLQVWCHQ